MNPSGRPGRILRRLEKELGDDRIKAAQILHSDGSKVYDLHIAPPESSTQIKVNQAGRVDGVITGILGADDTVHVHIRDDVGRDLSLAIRDLQLVRRLLPLFRSGVVRLHVSGPWIRSESGWHPDTKCLVEKFEVLEVSSAHELFTDLLRIDGNAISQMDDPVAYWQNLRGI